MFSLPYKITTEWVDKPIYITTNTENHHLISLEPILVRLSAYAEQEDCVLNILFIDHGRKFSPEDIEAGIDSQYENKFVKDYLNDLMPKYPKIRFNYRKEYNIISCYQTGYLNIFIGLDLDIYKKYKSTNYTPEIAINSQATDQGTEMSLHILEDSLYYNGVDFQYDPIEWNVKNTRDYTMMIGLTINNILTKRPLPYGKLLLNDTLEKTPIKQITIGFLEKLNVAYNKTNSYSYEYFNNVQQILEHYYNELLTQTNVQKDDIFPGFYNITRILLEIHQDTLPKDLIENIDTNIDTSHLTRHEKNCAYAALNKLYNWSYYQYLLKTFPEFERN